MTFNPITDSKAAIGETYDQERQVLTIQFRNGPYEYANVSPEKYAEFGAAESKGGWITANLTGTKNVKNHPFVKVTPPPEKED